LGAFKLSLRARFQLQRLAHDVLDVRVDAAGGVPGARPQLLLAPAAELDRAGHNLGFVRVLAEVGYCLYDVSDHILPLEFLNTLL
jgi:hypothetical protein